MRHIMHLDGDAFFVSVEAAKDPSLRGRPVVTGQERGIASAMSYEAKALGITRAMPVFQIRKEFPQVAVIDSDYESYAIFSRRMMDIVRRYTDIVEEYSIDECFADFTGIGGFDRDPRGTLSRIKADIKKELGISVSLGLGPTKVLAKTASKSQKPDGLVILEPDDIRPLLDRTPVNKVWGIGSATSFSLRKKGVTTALDLASKPLEWVKENFSKPMEEMWHELNGTSVRAVASEGEAQKSIMKTRTFWPASSDKPRVLSELSKNLENACRKARELGLLAREASIYLKTSDFSYESASWRLVAPSSDTFEILREAERGFDRIFHPGRAYRATGVTLYSLVPDGLRQEGLFGDSWSGKKSEAVLKAVDKINARYGKSLIHVAQSLSALDRRERGGKALPFMPRGISKRLSVPYLGDVS